MSSKKIASKLSVSNMTVGLDLCSSNRSFMFASMVAQAVELKNPEYNRLMSTYAADAGASVYRTTSERTMTVMAIIEKSKYVNTVLFIDEDGIIHHRSNQIFQKTAEKHLGVLMRTTEFKVGDVVSPGDVLSEPKNYEDGIPLDGINLIHMSASNRSTTEDSFDISVPGAKKLLSSEPQDVKILYDENNMLFRNLYGDENIHKPMPDIDEEIKDGILCAIAKNASFLSSDESLYNVSMDDTLYKKNGVILDIEVRHKIQRDEFGNIIQLGDTFLNQKRNDLIEYELTIEQEIRSLMSDDNKLSPDTQQFLDRITSMAINGVAYRKDNVVLNTTLIKVTMLNHCDIKVGSKVTGLYGNKGVIGNIIAEEDMPITEDGRRVEIITSSLSWVARFIAGPLLKSLRWYGHKIAKFLETADMTYSMKAAIIQEYYGIIYTKLEHSFVEAREILGLEEAVNCFIQPGEVRKDIDLVVPPVGGVNLKTCWDVHRMCRRYGVNVDKDVVYYKGKKMEHTFEIIDSFFLRLKQTAEDKASIRSVGEVDVAGMLVRSKQKKQSISDVGSTPVRFGEMELTLLTAFLHPDTIKDMIRPDKSPAIAIMDVYLNALGIELHRRNPSLDVSKVGKIPRSE